MNKSESKKIVPRLRFQEFKDSNPVSLEYGNEIFKQICNKDHNSDLPVLAITQEFGAIPRAQIDYKVSVTDKSLESYKIVEIGDFIISLRSFQGGIEYSLFCGICSPAYIILRKKTNIIEQYYKYYFKTNSFIQELNKDIEGIRDGKMVSYNQFSTILLPKPDNKEQQKIADCLVSLDNMINVEVKKLALLKDHKKTLLKKLFPSEGKTIPELRFPEFMDSGKWKKEPLSNLLYYERPDNYIVDDTNYKSNGIPVLTANKGFILGYTDEKYGIYDDIPIILFDDFTVDRKYVNFPFKVKSSAIKILKSKNKNNLKFVYELMNTIKFDPKEHKRYYISTYQNFEVFISKNIKEQQKIADFISSLDDLISAQTKKIKMLKLHKNGLMQGLFPSLDEVCE